MKNNSTAAFSCSPEPTKEGLFSGFSMDCFPGAAWTEFEDSFIQLLTGAEPAKKYFNTLEIQQQITF